MRGPALIVHRWALFGGLVLGAVAPAGAQEPSPLPAIDLILPASQERWRPAMTSAAESAAAVGRAWLGPHPTGSITQMRIDAPVWQGPGAMVVERQSAHAVIRTWWPDALADRQADAIVDGFSWYLQGHAVEQLFERRHLRAGHSVESVPLFGHAAYWSVPTLRLSRWSAGILRHDRGHAVPSRYAGLFATLERWVGVAALQAAMFEVARMPADRLSAAEMVSTINASLGQDLSWLFTAVDDPAVTFDYRLSELTSTAADCPPPCFETVVTAERLGSGQFTGRSAERVGGFDSGDAMALRVTFANGESGWARWDGRDQARTFRFRGPSPAESAHLDPDRVLVLDANYLNNQIVPATPTNAPVAKWMARWIVWVQNTVLSYGFFA